METINHYFFPVVIAVLFIIAIIWGLCALSQVYGVWSAHKEGQADLARAQNDQQVQVAEAQGRLNAATLNKDAEIIDATAVAKSVEIIGKALHENQGYLQWKWIHMMQERESGDTIYVPTEASLPILEAGRRLKE
jgi:regulator of protease activity HflC (stomatin/prohibitin superfamily)